MNATIRCVEIGMFQRVVNAVFVVFGYMENKWAEPSVLVAVVLPPCGCSSDGYDYALGGFSDFYGGGVYGGDEGFLVVGFYGDWFWFELDVGGVLVEGVECWEVLGV